MDPKKLAEILNHASKEASKTHMPAQAKLNEKIKATKAGVKIADEAAMMMLAMEGEAKASSRASNDGIASTVTYSGALRI